MNKNVLRYILLIAILIGNAPSGFSQGPPPPTPLPPPGTPIDSGVVVLLLAGLGLGLLKLRTLHKKRQFEN